MRAAVVVALFLAASCASPPPPPVEQLDLLLEQRDMHVPLSDEEFRSPTADLVLTLPERWSILPHGSSLAEGTIGLALSPDLTMALVMQRIPPSHTIADAIAQRNWRNLARACFERRLQRIGNTLQLIGGFHSVGYDQLRFGVYRFIEFQADSTEARSTRVASVVTSEGNIYELSLTPLRLTLDRTASEQALDSVFHLLLHLLRVR